MVSMTRPIDNLGRVVIPMEIRKQLNWEPGTKVDICGTDNGIQLTTHVEDSPISQVKKLKEMLCNVQPSSEISDFRRLPENGSVGKNTGWKSFL